MIRTISDHGFIRSSCWVPALLFSTLPTQVVGFLVLIIMLLFSTTPTSQHASGRWRGAQPTSVHGSTSSERRATGDGRQTKDCTSPTHMESLLTPQTDVQHAPKLFSGTIDYCDCAVQSINRARTRTHYQSIIHSISRSCTRTHNQMFKQTRERANTQSNEQARDHANNHASNQARNQSREHATQRQEHNHTQHARNHLGSVGPRPAFRIAQSNNSTIFGAMVVPKVRIAAKCK